MSDALPRPAGAGESCDIVSINPARPDEVVFTAPQASGAQIDGALARARAAQAAWSRRSLHERTEVLLRWQAEVRASAEPLARMITAEMGKTLAESRAEVASVIDKVSITLDESLLARTREFTVTAGAGKVGRCTFRPHGVMVVLGPFNFPAHLPNGHFTPALLLGNAVVLKPSERCPGVGNLLGALAERAGFPEGVFQVLQGGAAVAARLVSHPEVDGVLFTGSWPVGRRIMEANLDHPGRMLALEMGGSSAAIVADDASLKQAVIECTRSAFATTGQRCTCTRRIIVHEAIAGRFIGALCKAASTLIVGPGDAPEPVFMGPLVTEAARASALAFQSARVAAGAELLLRGVALDRPGWFMTPSVLKVARFDRELDEEIFGPVVQVSTARDDADAVDQANATHFGLAASVFTHSDERFRTIARELKAGCVNWNTGTAGASSRLPFGGLGRSGNHRPAAAFAGDYCVHPVAQMEVSGDDAPLPQGMLWDERWLQR